MEMVMTIKKEGNAFIVSVYSTIRDIILKKPADMWECSDVIPDEDTMNYLSDKKILEYLFTKERRDAK